MRVDALSSVYHLFIPKHTMDSSTSENIGENTTTDVLITMAVNTSSDYGVEEATPLPTRRDVTHPNEPFYRKFDKKRKGKKW